VASPAWPCFCRLPADLPPARSPHDAVEQFRLTIGRALSCLTNVVPKLDRFDPTKDLHVATLDGQDPVVFATAYGRQVGLIVTIQYRVVNDPGAGGWLVRMAAYEYKVTDEQGRELLVYHWHPEWQGEHDFAHLHLQHQLLSSAWGLFEDKHLPTARIALADVLRLLLQDLGVAPNRDDWAAVLARASTG
jgi:hypothetical protein